MSLKDTYTSAWDVVPVDIAAGSSLTDAINLGGLRLFGIVMPAAWTTANLTFQMSPDAGTTWVNILDQNGNEVLSSGDVSTYVAMNTPSNFAPVQYLRVRSGSSSVSVAQAAKRTLNLMVRSV